MANAVKNFDSIVIASIKNINGLAAASLKAIDWITFTSSSFPQSSSLVGYWKLDETSGTSVADSKWSNTGTLTGMTVNQSGANAKIGTAYKMGVASTDHITLSNWRPANNFSINFWVKNNSDAGNRIITEFNAQSTAGWWIIDGGNSSGAGRFWCYSGWSLTYYTTATSSNYWYNSSAWRMVTCVRTSDTSKIWVDWVLDGSTTFGWDVTYQASDVFSIGWFYNNWPYAQCASVYLDEVWTWSTALVQADIDALYNSGAWLTYTP